MHLENLAVAVVLGLTAAAAAEANAASATCRELHTGAADRVCRWQVGKGDFVDVYYGPPSPTAPPPAPRRSETNHAEPPAEYAAPTYYYGDALPFVVGADKAQVRGRRHGSRLIREPHHGSSLTSVGRPRGFHGGFQGTLQSGGLRGHGGGGRR